MTDTTTDDIPEAYDLDERLWPTDLARPGEAIGAYGDRLAIQAEVEWLTLRGATR